MVSGYKSINIISIWSIYFSEHRLGRIRIRNTKGFLKSFYQTIKLGLTELMVQE